MSGNGGASASSDVAVQHEIIADVIDGAKLPAKRRGTSIKPAVERLCSACYENGVLPDALTELIDLITTPNFLDQASLNSIVRNLYPASAVDSDIVIKVVGCLGLGVLKPSLAIQAALLRWLIMIYHIIGKQSVLSKSYAVLFNLLDTAAIRPQLCHLLALITRRKHVRPYRIQALLELSRQTGNDPPITGLMRVFKDYYPEIIVGEAARGKASAFKHPDPAWRERLDEIQAAHAQSLDASDRPRDAFRVFRQNGRGRAGAVPEVHTSHAQEESTTLEEIENVEGLVKGLETIQLPNQLISVLADPLLQKLMLLKPDAECHQRVSNWLVSCAQDLLSGEADEELEGILETLASYASSTKNLPPVVLSFFAEYLKVWNGQDGRESILGILSYAPLPGDFSELYDNVFRPLEAKLLDGSADSQLQLLRCYTALLRHWTILLLSRGKSQIPQAKSISELITYVNKLCLTVVQTSASTSTQSQVLDFYEAVAELESNPTTVRQVRIVIPPSPLVYLLHFSSSPAILSRLCGVLARYKEGFQLATTTSRIRYPPEYINEFNSFLMDICNCLWRSRAFNAKDANSHACLMPPTTIQVLTAYADDVNVGVPLSALFTLSTTPSLGLLATTYLRELEDAEIESGTAELDVRHAGPVTRASLAALARDGGMNMSWDEFRQGVLVHLEGLGMDGVGVLMNNTMTTLMSKRGSST